MDYTPQEMMAIATGRELKAGELAIFGVGLSMLAGFFAQHCHAPGLQSITEGGVFGATPVGGLPWGIECNRLAVNATCFSGALDALGCFVASGRCDVGVIGAAQVDRFGNVNTTGIWGGRPRSHPPQVRLSGSGGANDIACGAGRFVVMLQHERKRFVDRVDYISSPGYLSGGDAREGYGFPGQGPTAVVTSLGILRPHPESRELLLSEFFEFSDPEIIRQETGWDLQVSPDVQVTQPPTPHELEVLRRVDSTGMLRRRA
ncbi:CoA-transferase subunit beta [Ectothiorhodospira lacustris]|uniref:CoA-transferase subunit beta n=1 Tax=Ectothiorhodospira lacustris TaxID=2899127 RepID=UPI001EE7C80A|nr:CoA-transferase [Ectothiorhodospira lacustris]MCG5501341.1 hypothetical protein [Ectothiorhodospira lacustris]